MSKLSSALGSEITDAEYASVRKLLHGAAGISLGDAKKTLVVSRLARRLQECKVANFSEYLRLLADDSQQQERQLAVDLLTTNETYFFREEKHFTHLRSLALAFPGGRPFRVWSAACSFGQEAYSAAMVLDAALGAGAWEILGSDISTRVLDTAKRGLYALAQAERIPREYLARYCLKGIGAHQGSFMIEPGLRKQLAFFHGNLIADLPGIGHFDVIFLRNVMIYFDSDTKRKVVEKLSGCLRRGGQLLIGHSESLNGVNDSLKMLSPSIYVKP